MSLKIICGGHSVNLYVSYCNNYSREVKMQIMIGNNIFDFIMSQYLEN